MVLLFASFKLWVYCKQFDNTIMLRLAHLYTCSLLIEPCTYRRRTKANTTAAPGNGVERARNTDTRSRYRDKGDKGTGTKKQTRATCRYVLLGLLLLLLLPRWIWREIGVYDDC